MTTHEKVVELEELESVFDNVFHDLMFKMNSIMERDTETMLVYEYSNLQEKIQKILCDTYPDYKFENFGL